jgi:hypothetical protein
MKDLAGYEPAGADADDAVLPQERAIEEPSELERVEEAMRERCSREGRGERLGRALEIGELCQRVRHELDRRRGSLTALARLAGPAIPAGHWAAAVQRLRQSPQALHEALVRALAEERLRLADAWQALDVEPFHRLVPEVEMRGSAARAYAALLAAGQGGTLGKYTWILQHDEMQTLNNLRVAFSYFLAALGRMYRHNFRVLTKALRTRPEPVVVWALVLVHNAHRARLDPRDSRAIADYGPLSPPDGELWQQAWTAALRMDHAPVSALLVQCCSGQANQRGAAELEIALRCPAGWNVP